MEIATGVMIKDYTSSSGKKYKIGDKVKVVGVVMDELQQELYMIHLSNGSIDSVETSCVGESE